MGGSHTRRSTLESALVVVFFTLAASFNLDQEYAVLKTDPNVGNLFGFSVALHQHNATDESTGEEKKEILSWILVGAPKANNSFLQASVKTPGTVFKCNALTTKASCDGEIAFDTRRPSSSESKDNQWLGVSLKSGGLNQPVATCAHRYLFKTSSVNFHLYEGVCRTATKLLERDAQFNPCRPYNQDDLNAAQVPSQSRYGQCLAGIGLDAIAESSPAQFEFGAVGSVFFSGRVMEMDELNSGARPIESQITESNLGASSIGYSITHGTFFDKTRLDVAAGGPKGQSRGQVYMFERLGVGASRSMKTKQVLPNTHDKIQIGSAFGFALCAIDSDNDGYAELAISAPFHEEADIAGQGIVYIYHNKGGAGTFVLASKLKVKGSRINFGMSFSCSDDLNLDGHRDLVVGAPYDDNGAGAVYIFQGSDKGIMDTFTQKVTASSVAPGLVAFGRSLSGGADIDSNGYPDIVVGAPGSMTVAGAAVVLRTRPVIRIFARLSFRPDVIDTNVKECFVVDRNTTCFTFGVCLRYTEMSNRLTAPEELIYKLVADPGRSPRVRFTMSDRSTLIQKVLVSNVEKCYGSRGYIVYDKDGTIPVYPDLEFSLEYELPPPGPLVPDVPGQLASLDKHPMLERDYDATGAAILKTKIQATLNFKRPCTPCIPDLALATDKNQTVRLGSATYNLNVTLSNVGPDPAYAVRLIIDLPVDVTLSRVEIGVKLPQCGNPIVMGNLTRIVCEDLFHEFASGKKTNFTVVLDTKSVAPLVLHRTVKLNVTSANFELTALDNNIAEVSLGVIAVADISLQGTALTRREVYGGTVTGESAMTYEEDVGHVVRHNYYVVNDGPDLIPRAEVTIYWPYEAVSGKHLLYLVSVTSDAAVCSFAEDQINMLKLKSKATGKVAGADSSSRVFTAADLSRVRRETTDDNTTLPAPPPTTDPVPTTASTVVTGAPMTGKPSQGNVPNRPSIEGRLLDCRKKTAECTEIKCSVSNFERNKGVTIAIKSRIWNTTFLQDYYGDIVTIASYSTVKMASNASYVKEIDLGNNNAEAFTTLSPSFVAERKGDLSGYVVPLAVVAGILLLALLIFVLYKMGFFHRNRSNYTPRDKPDKEGADDSLLKGKRQNGDD